MVSAGEYMLSMTGHMGQSAEDRLIVRDVAAVGAGIACGNGDRTPIKISQQPSSIPSTSTLPTLQHPPDVSDLRTTWCSVQEA
jgi:hypothetical protein